MILAFFLKLLEKFQKSYLGRSSDSKSGFLMWKLGCELVISSLLVLDPCSCLIFIINPCKEIIPHISFLCFIDTFAYSYIISIDYTIYLAQNHEKHVYTLQILSCLESVPKIDFGLKNQWTLRLREKYRVVGLGLVVVSPGGTSHNLTR